MWCPLPATSIPPGYRYPALTANLGAAEMLAALRTPREHRRVDGETWIPNPLARVDIGKVVIETTVVGHRLPQKAQSGENALACICRRNVAPLFSNAQRSESESGRGDAADNSVIIAAHVAAILPPGFRIGLFPEEPDIGSLQFIEECVVLRLQSAW